ncbi:transposase [Fundidesulfovibrio putealis]|uniref:transposase n=1 Tax=Fundidesulfovibrio putealis TaxID=270496 RepID=UPI0012EB5DB5|nr:transposase [Fundidesulfovibrio putealis]
MKRRKWTSAQKALIVLECLRGRPIGELCNEHGLAVRGSQLLKAKRKQTGHKALPHQAESVVGHRHDRPRQ